MSSKNKKVDEDSLYEGAYHAITGGSYEFVIPDWITMEQITKQENVVFVDSKGKKMLAKITPVQVYEGMKEYLSRNKKKK